MLVAALAGFGAWAVFEALLVVVGFELLAVLAVDVEGLAACVLVAGFEAVEVVAGFDACELELAWVFDGCELVCDLDV